MRSPSTLARLRATLACALVVLTGALLAIPASAGAGVGTVRPAASDPCAGLKLVGDDGLCTHGGDELSGRGVAARSASAVFAAAPPAPCPADGASGRRVRVMYGYPAGTDNKIATRRPFIREAVAMADANLDAATPGTDGQHYRFFCESDDVVTVTVVKLKKKGNDGKYTFGDVIDSLERQKQLGLGKKNYLDSRFVYSIFVDNIGCCYRYAGQGSMFLDDRSNPETNDNNALGASFTRYSMVRLGFSPLEETGFFQHEVGHNLGAVQDSAPQSSGAGHCYESADVMCYNDDGPWFQNGGSMVPNCPAMPDGQDVWDCGADDYYAQSLSGGSYLADNWNLVDSGWLSWAA